MTDLAATIWKPGQGQGEMSADGGLNFVTLQGDNLVTQNSDQLVTKESTYTELAPTEWAKSEGS